MENLAGSAFEILSLRRVHRDDFTLADKWRDLYHEAGFELGGFLDVGGRSPFHSRFSLYDFQVHGGRQLDIHRPSLEQLHLNDHIRNEVGGAVLDNRLVQADLFVGLRVHEEKGIAVGIKVLHIDFIEIGFLDRVLRSEAVIDERAGAQVAHAGLNESTQVTRRAVLGLVNGEEFAVVSDDHTWPHIVGIHERSFEWNGMGLKRGGKPKQSGPAAPQEAILAFSCWTVNQARRVA